MENHRTDTITIRIPQKTKEQLEWLRANGYGSVSSIVRGLGIVKYIVEMYVDAKKAEGER